MTVRAVSVALLAGLWLVFAGSGSAAELVACVAITALAAGAHHVMRALTGERVSARSRWAARALRDWPRRIARDTAIVTRASLRAGAHPGAVRRIAMGDRSNAELLWSVVGTSISPNAYVIGDDDGRALLVHELVPSGAPDGEIVWWPR